MAATYSNTSELNRGGIAACQRYLEDVTQLYHHIGSGRFWATISPVVVQTRLSYKLCK